MKKTLKKLLVAALSLTFVFTGLFGCTANNWDASSVTLKNGGAVIENGGFIAETENYYYFINGIGVSSSDNTFGAPVKGALVAVDKADLTNSCVVVPKLFCASDYNTGVTIYGDYVYYGSPSTDKDPSGNIAYTEMTFARTKLDSTGAETFFTVNDLSVEYRFVEKDGVVYLLYYNAAKTALVAYNTTSKTETVIAKTDIEAESESLDKYKFTEDGEIVYTVTVYKDAFNQTAKDEQGDSYSRTTESYNKVYLYNVGDASDDECVGTVILDGKQNGTGSDLVFPYTYELSMVSGNYVIYTAKDSSANAISKTYIFDATQAFAPQEVKNTAYAADGALIVSPSEVYKYTDGNMLVKTSLLASDNVSLVYLANPEAMGKLLFVYGDYFYYVSSTNYLARIFIGADATGMEDYELKEQKVSDNTIATDWYAPELIGSKIFYVDNSAEGRSYVKYIDIATATVEEEKDDKDEITALYLTGSEFVGKIASKDRAGMVTSEIEGISSKLDGGKIAFEKDDDGNVLLKDGKPYMQAVIDARASYNALGKDKEHVSADTLKLLEKYEEAVRVSVIFYKLDGWSNDADDLTKEAFKDAYNAAKAALNALDKSDKFETSDIRALLYENCNWNYQEADKYFNPDKD